MQTTKCRVEVRECDKISESSSRNSCLVRAAHSPTLAPNGIDEVPLTPLAVEAFRCQMAITPENSFLFPSDRTGRGYQATFKTVWSKTLRRAKVPYFRIYHLRSTYAARLSDGGVSDEWVTQMLRQGDAHVMKKYSLMKLQMKRKALEKPNRLAGEIAPVPAERMCTIVVQ